MGSWILLIIGTVLWGLWGLANRFALDRANPFTVQWMYALPYLLTLPLFAWLGARQQPQTNTDGTALLWSVGSGVAAILAYVLLLVVMQQGIPPSIATAAQSAYPAVTLLLGVLLRIETLDWYKVAGLVLIVAGVIVLTLSPAGRTG